MQRLQSEDVPRQQRLHHVWQRDHEPGDRRINPTAVETAFKLGAKVVWLPTASAKTIWRKWQTLPSVEVVKDGRVVPELLDVFRLVKDYDGVLGTAHVSPEECKIVVEAARTPVKKSW